MPGSAATFAQRLRSLRESRSLTQEELAERSGITVKAIGALERGERQRPYPHTVRSLADALRLDDSERTALVAAVPGRAPRGATDEPVAPGPPERATSAPVTLLVGRDDDVERVRRLLADGQRLVTLTGPGGVGKTRLALEVLARHGDSLADRQLVVEVSALREPASVLPSIAAALGVPEGNGQATPSTLALALAARRVLVLLDNLEHLLDAATELAELVAAAPDLLLLVTSRAPLRVRSEHEVPLAPLVGAAAVELFVDRATAAGAEVSAAGPDAAALADLCDRLGGLPLAIELAAARARLLTPAAMLERLGRGPLGGGPRDLPDRHRSMDAALRWSLDLLDDDQRSTFDQLAVFVDGWPLDALDAVVDSADAFADLGALVEQALVLPTGGPDGQARYRLLEPVRQFALARLHASGRTAEVAARQADWVSRTAAAARPDLHGPGLRPALDRLSADHANVRAGFLRLLETDRADAAAALVADVWLYLGLRGHAREGLQWLGSLEGGQLDDAGRCAALTATAGLSFVTGDIPRMTTSSLAALAQARDLGLTEQHVEAAILAGHAAVFTGDTDSAQALLDEALETTRACGDRWGEAHALLAQGQLELVRTHPAAADAVLLDAEGLARALGNPFTLASVLNRRATVTALQGDDLATAELLAESADLSVSAGISWTLSYALPALAGLAVRLGQPEPAAYLFGATASLSLAHAVDPLFPVARELEVRDLDLAREQLGADAFRQAWDRGRTAGRSDVVGVARDVIDRARG